MILFGLLLGLVVLCFCVIILGCCGGVLLSVGFLSLSGYAWNIEGMIEDVTVGILLMLAICFLYVYFYTGHYFGFSIEGVELNGIICLFVGVMAMLVLTGDFLTTLVFWEHLGVVSYFLILFYGSYLSLHSSIVTLVSSRFGDICLFFLLCLGGYILSDVWWWPLIIFFFIVFTKSASFPFISWLLEAMRAPTPVSSLVHSSTLVAAGVWFSMRYDFLLFLDNCFVFSVGLLITIVITGVACFFFLDLKKIVALSTCNNISWCVFYLIFGDMLISLFQLISHGVSKCILFILVGDVMSGTSGSQASNYVYNARLYGNWGVFGLVSTVLGLSGVPFIGVFFTKHFLLSNFMNVQSSMFTLIVFVCVFLSYFYSFRLCSILLNLKSSAVLGVLFTFNVGGMLYFWLCINYFVAFILDEGVLLSGAGSWSLIAFQLFSCITAWFLYESLYLAFWSSSLFGSDNVVEFCYELFFGLRYVINIFLYRWDSYSILLASGVGKSMLGVYAVSVLSLVIFAVIMILMCWCIV